MKVETYRVACSFCTNGNTAIMEQERGSRSRDLDALIGISRTRQESSGRQEQAGRAACSKSDHDIACILQDIISHSPEDARVTSKCAWILTVKSLHIELSDHLGSRQLRKWLSKPQSFTQCHIFVPAFPNGKKAPAGDAFGAASELGLLRAPD